MADYVVVEILEAVVWCVEQIVLTFAGVIEGIMGFLFYIPAFIENSFILLELFILGMLSCVKFIISSLWYALSFIVNLPENLNDALVLFESGVSEGFQLTLSGIGFVFTSMTWCLAQIILLVKQLLFYTFSFTKNLLHLTFSSTVHVFHSAVSYLTTSAEHLLLILTDKLKQLILLPVVLSQDFIEVSASAAKSVFSLVSNAVSFLWKLPAQALNKLFSGFQYCLSFLYPVKGDQERAIPQQFQVDWLARFSQLMLVFSVIIFVSVAIVVLYHMRYKIFASLATVLNLMLSKLSTLIRRQENNRGNVENPEHPHFLQIQREFQEESDEEDVGGDVESSDDDSGVSGTQIQENGSAALRGGSRERSPQPSSSSSSFMNYKTLLQQERDKQLCVVCQDNEKNTLLFPCKHLCVCDRCVEMLTSAVNLDARRCPICRQKIKSYMDVFT